MLNKIFTLLKRIIVSLFILFGYNLILNRFNIIIPINIYTIVIVSLFSNFGFIYLVLLFKVVAREQKLTYERFMLHTSLILILS